MCNLSSCYVVLFITIVISLSCSCFGLLLLGAPLMFILISLWAAEKQIVAQVNVSEFRPEVFSILKLHFVFLFFCTSIVWTEKIKTPIIVIWFSIVIILLATCPRPLIVKIDYLNQKLLTPHWEFVQVLHIFLRDK